MSSHDYVIANDTGANVRADLNLALLASQSQNSGSSEPSTTYAYQWWADTTTGLLKQRNAANNAWITILTLATGAVASATTELSGDASPQLGADLDCNGSQIQWSQGADVASATALAVLTDGNYFDVTGTTTITSINTTGGVGTQIKLHFDGALTLTHHATDLILPGGANITTAAGDEAEFIEWQAGDYRCTNYTKASGQAVVSGAGLQTIWIPAAAMRPASAGGCATITDIATSANQPDMQVLDFDSSTEEHAQFSIAMPKSWDESTAITAKFYWTHATAVDTDVVWGIEGVCVSDNDTIDVAYGTAVTVTDTFHDAAEDLAVSGATGNVTVGGSPAEGDLAFFQVFRKAADSNDTTNSTDARLIGVKILFTTDAENDD